MPSPRSQDTFGAQFFAVLLAAILGVVFFAAAYAFSQDDSDPWSLDLPVDKNFLPRPKAPAAKPVEKLPPPQVDLEVPEDPPTFYGQKLVEASSLVYVIDCSGSMGLTMGSGLDMNGWMQVGLSRMERAKAEIARSVESLPVSIKFNIVAYESRIWSWSKILEEADAGHKKSARAFIADLQPSGMTETGPAVVVALKLNPNVICLLSDGAPNGSVAGWWGVAGEQLEINWHRDLIRSTNKGRCQINVYGVGCEGAFKEFCVNVAGDNRGSFTEVN